MEWHKLNLNGLITKKYFQKEKILTHNLGLAWEWDKIHKQMWELI
jgi:hypothetical protein